MHTGYENAPDFFKDIDFFEFIGTHEEFYLFLETISIENKKKFIGDIGYSSKVLQVYKNLVNDFFNIIPDIYKNKLIKEK